LGNYHYTQTTRRRIGKVISPLNDKLKNVEWGEYELDILFEKIKVKSLKYKTSELPSKATDRYDLPALTAGIQNQGLNNYVPKDNATILKNVISISANGANTGATFYQNKEFTVLQDAYAIQWKDSKENLSDNQYIFLTTAISKTIYGNYEWTNKAGWERIKSVKIKFPVKNGKIDFEFMEHFVAELEAKHIKEIENYLSDIGLNDYKLTEQEKQVLKDFETDRLKLDVFEISKLFTIHNTKSFNKNKLVPGNEYDYVTRTSQNQGVFQKTGFVNSKNINLAGNWSLGLMQMDFFYRKNPWYAGQFVRKINFKGNLAEKKAIYFSVLLNKFKNKLLTVLVRDVDELFMKSKIELPISKNKEIDYNTIDNLISAIQKLVIKDVVLYVERKKEELNKITENANA